MICYFSCAQSFAIVKELDSGSVKCLGVGFTSRWTAANQTWMSFGGTIDDVRIYYRTIFAIEVDTLYHYGIPYPPHRAPAKSEESGLCI